MSARCEHYPIYIAASLVAGMTRSEAATCERVLQANMCVIAEREPVVSESKFGLDQIAELVKRSGGAPHSAPLGFSTAQLTGSVDVSLDHGPGGACLPHIKIEHHLQLARCRIEIGREVVSKPCLYDAVLTHYRKKAVADEAAFAGYVDRVAPPLHATPFAGVAAHIEAGLDDTTRTEVKRWVTSVFDPYLQSFHNARAAAQRAFDTPEKLRSPTQACGRNA
jgi:hypothetical protein